MDHAWSDLVLQGGEEGVGVQAMMLRKAMLGSRPPSCEGRCRSSCGRRCEAVQVPVTPHDLLQMLRDRRKKKTLQEAGAGGGRSSGGVSLPSSYEDHSNYKPLGWRCKCLHS
ncbi:hypothetical protein QYE76_000415 [Lolium multiflorum]|uniref:Epidermal patterning factor-like protein n=1 Tax=Lolium multiflorum TaxID=4521 RepID=A0AAD8RI85_LOLMU|nr:hypothetical protein QYE76_000135 [Lolium multiflorum]KAK1626100.1 hypothetical protein QYE76_000415 [Lolium multiflorum]